ncbi:MAG: RNA polymerase sigma factor [Planctomycetota bacterium]
MVRYQNPETKMMPVAEIPPESCQPPTGPLVYSGGMSSVSIDAEAVRQLVAEARRGHPEAADRLVREHESWVRSAIYAVTGRADLVDDIAQQVWARVWERLDTLENPRRLKAWLYAVARNAAIDACQARRRQQASVGSKGELPPVADAAVDPSAATAGEELRRALLRAVQALPAIYREPFVLRHLEDWSYAQIGEVLGLSPDTVETRLVRARRLLREMLQGKVE